MSFADAIKRAAEASPMAAPTTGVVAGRVLYADGDGLAYYCAGNDACSPGQARVNLIEKLASAKRACGAERVVVLLTSPGSHKGYRYAIATVKPYQGQRSNSRRPNNWAILRQLMEGHSIPGVQIEATSDLEADDLFGQHGHADPENTVIYTQDKDMRMVPGWHLNWDTHRMTYLAPGVYEHTFCDKVYGTKWFWLQMLHGDTADWVPGLPKYVKENGREALCGEKTAATLLAPANNSAAARAIVTGLYSGYYGPDLCHPAMLEQACLLWMRRTSNVFDCAAPGGPLAGVPHEYMAAITRAVKEADAYAANQNN